MHASLPNILNRQISYTQIYTFARAALLQHIDRGNIVLHIAMLHMILHVPRCPKHSATYPTKVSQQSAAAEGRGEVSIPKDLINANALSYKSNKYDLSY